MTDATMTLPHVHSGKPHLDSKAGKGTAIESCIFLAPNGVVLARRVPTEAVTGLIPASKAGRQGEHHALGLLGLAPDSAGADSE